MEKLSLIDVASEDDFLVSPGNQCFLDPTASIEMPELHRSGSATKEEMRSKKTSLNEEIPELCQSPVYKSSKSGINLRKSLAWDSAFFTCEGVLNTEELAIINTNFSQAGKSPLAGIPEESRRSGESTTTLDTDSWTLESLETELFDNVRASIQKSLGSSGKEISNSLRKKGSNSNPSRLGLSAKEKVTRASQSKVKIPTGEKKAVRLPPKQPQNAWKRASLDSKVMATAGGSIQSKTTSANANANAPRMLPKPNLPRNPTKTTVPPVNIQKRSSTGTALTRKPVSKPSSHAPNIPTSRSMVGPPRCAPITSSTNTNNKKISSFASPNPKTKPPTCKNNTNKPQTSTRTPIKPSPKSKTGHPNKPNPLTRLPSISPRSSIDSVRSTNTTDSVSRGSPISLSGLNSSTDVIACGSKSLSRSSSSSSIASQERSLKPSGLRMPSLKLGYFDGGKSQVNTNGTSLHKPGFFGSPQINANCTSTVKPASSPVTEDPVVESERQNCVEKENITPLIQNESDKVLIDLIGEKISSLSLPQV